MTLNEAITTFQEAQHEFIGSLNTLPVAKQEQSGARGVWSPKDVIAHLTGWMQEAMRRYPRYALGTGDIKYNIDAYNALNVRLRRLHSYDAVLAEFHHVADQWMAMANAVTLQQHEHDKRYAHWLTSLARELREHGEQMAAFAKVTSS